MTERSRIDLDKHTVTCLTYDKTESSQDISRTALSNLIAFEDNFARNHRCGKWPSITARNEARVHLPEIGNDPWRAAWQRYEASQ
jgi:hypothetical protein